MTIIVFLFFFYSAVSLKVARPTNSVFANCAKLTVPLAVASSLLNYELYNEESNTLSQTQGEYVHSSKMSLLI